MLTTLVKMVTAFDVDFGVNAGSSPSLKTHRSSITIDTPSQHVRNISLQGHHVLLCFSQLFVIWDLELTKYISIRVPDWSSGNQVSSFHWKKYVGIVSNMMNV